MEPAPGRGLFCWYNELVKLDPLTVLKSGDDILWVAGAEHGTRSDGSSSLMVSQAYCAHRDFVEGEVVVDEVGQEWCLTRGVSMGFYMDGIILEEKEYYDGNAE